MEVHLSMIAKLVEPRQAPAGKLNPTGPVSASYSSRLLGLLYGARVIDSPAAHKNTRLFTNDNNILAAFPSPYGSVQNIAQDHHYERHRTTGSKIPSRSPTPPADPLPLPAEPAYDVRGRVSLVALDAQRLPPAPLPPSAQARIKARLPRAPGVQSNVGEHRWTGGRAG